MVMGKVISFDRIKGYGFVAPETGGEDVFIHVNDLYSEKDLLTTGSVVEFRLEEGERGPKAAAVTVIRPANGHGADADPFRGPVGTGHAPVRAASADGEELADALSPGEFAHEVTEALLRVEPELTSRQILDIRKRLTRVAQEHGWLEN